MYGLTDYLMALQEVEKARLADRARQERSHREPLPDWRNPAVKKDSHIDREARKRLRRVN